MTLPGRRRRPRIPTTSVPLKGDKTWNHADPRHRYRTRRLCCRRARHRGEQTDRPEIAGDEARPCRSPDAVDRTRHEGVRRWASLRSTKSPSPPAPAVSPGCASAFPPRAALRSPPTSRWSGWPHADRLCRAPVVAQNAAQPVISAIDARHDHVYFQVVSGDGSSLVRPRVAPVEEALEAARFGAPHLVGNAAQLLRRPLAGRWAAAVQGRCPNRRRTLPGWPGWAPRSVRMPRRRGLIICARPTPNRRRTRCSEPCHRRRHDGSIEFLAFRMVARRHRGGRARHPARRGPSGATPRRGVSSRLGRSRIRDHAERAQHAGSSSTTGAEDHRLCGVADGGGQNPAFCRSRLPPIIAAVAFPAPCC